VNRASRLSALRASILTQIQIHACCILVRMRRFHRAGDKAAVTFMAPRRSDVSGVCILSPGAVLTRRAGRSTAVSSHKVNKLRQKLFARDRKTFCLRPCSPPYSVAPLPCAARELTREMDNHHHRRKPECTHETSKPPLKNLPERWGKAVSYTILVADKPKTQRKSGTSWNSAALLR
jgi:hypothetical protein